MAGWKLKIAGAPLNLLGSGPSPKDGAERYCGGRREVWDVVWPRSVVEIAGWRSEVWGSDGFSCASYYPGQSGRGFRVFRDG
jgi:hypothetical protein